ncbi:hypothetical protein [Noviherbaspirillum pedocola]|uniref:Uncharacterized protein n=1 Tax=Noviherbaspirillum pedocola TaxID=2801341 RepID=A0A934T0K2_9BURK|nr:hypothetical protein [Noviherbaspirillum pedocola]MBK4736562.1 hypothetical protein [Noviherbaspirillum pedocola]
MSNQINTRQIAEHLTTLASLLEAEAIRMNTLGIVTKRSVALEARAVRALATRLWDADMHIALVAPGEAEPHETVSAEMPGKLALVQ